MAEEAPRGRNRRRYFRRKGGDKAQAGAPQAPPDRAPAPEARAEGASAGGRSRSGRRKRRGRKGKNGDQRVDTLLASSEQEIEYELPASVFIYTHIVRPSSGAYEFRSEHFSKVGRTLDDYKIEIDSLFTPLDVEARRRDLEQIFADWDYGEDEDDVPAPASDQSEARDDLPAEPTNPD